MRGLSVRPHAAWGLRLGRVLALLPFVEEGMAAWETLARQSNAELSAVQVGTLPVAFRSFSLCTRTVSCSPYSGRWVGGLGTVVPMLGKLWSW